MGMFDTIVMPVKCPECGETKDRQCQTKDLDRQLEKWVVGDIIDTEFKSLDCITSCGHCDSYFTLDAHLDNGRVTGEYTIQKHWNYRWTPLT